MTVCFALAWCRRGCSCWAGSSPRVGAGIDIADLGRLGVAVIIGTGDAEFRPELSRAWGPSLSEDGARLTVCVEAAP